MVFMRHLHQLVITNYPKEIDRVRYVLDGAGYHRSKESRAFYKEQGMHIIFLAPYSYLISV